MLSKARFISHVKCDNRESHSRNFTKRKWVFISVLFWTHLTWPFGTNNNNLWMATFCNNGWHMKNECGFRESSGAEGTNYLDCDSVCELKGLSHVTLLVCHWCAQQVWSHRHLSPLISDAVAWSIRYRALDLSEYLLLFSIPELKTFRCQCGKFVVNYWNILLYDLLVCALGLINLLYKQISMTRQHLKFAKM